MIMIMIVVQLVIIIDRGALRSEESTKTYYALCRGSGAELELRGAPRWTNMHKATAMDFMPDSDPKCKP